jgi:hypothetical protein
MLGLRELRESMREEGIIHDERLLLLILAYGAPSRRPAAIVSMEIQIWRFG